MTYLPVVTTRRISRDYGYVFGGDGTSAVTEKYDDVNNSWSIKANMNTSRGFLSGFSMNGYGYSACGDTQSGGGTVSGVVEKYDDVNNTWTTKQAVNTARRELTGFAVYGFGYTIGGWIAATQTATEKYDDVLNTWTAKTALSAGRNRLSGFEMNGYGFIASGATSNQTTNTGEAQVYDTVANTWTVKTACTARRRARDFSLNSYGYVTGGFEADESTRVEKYDYVNNTWTAKQNLNTARMTHAVFNCNGFGYVVAGYDSTPTAIATSEKYDDILNTWTAKPSITNVTSETSGFSVGALKDGVLDIETMNIYNRINREMIPVDITASRALDTAYTNTSTYNILVVVTARCIIDTLADVANIQAFSDTNADPSTAASGISGIEGGLAGEDVSVAIPFIVRPTYKYKVTSTASAGCTVTLGKWFETPLK